MEYRFLLSELAKNGNNYFIETLIDVLNLDKSEHSEVS